MDYIHCQWLWHQTCLIAQRCQQFPKPAQLHRVAQTEGLEYLHQCPLQTAGPVHAPHQQKDRSLNIHITTPQVKGNGCKIRAFHAETISAFTIAISFCISAWNLTPISRTVQGIRWRFNQMYSVLMHSSTTPGQQNYVENLQDSAANGCIVIKMLHQGVGTESWSYLHTLP